MTATLRSESPLQPPCRQNPPAHTEVRPGQRAPQQETTVWLGVRAADPARTGWPPPPAEPSPVSPASRSVTSPLQPRPRRRAAASWRSCELGTSRPGARLLLLPAGCPRPRPPHLCSCRTAAPASACPPRFSWAPRAKRLGAVRSRLRPRLLSPHPALRSRRHSFGHSEEVP